MFRRVQIIITLGALWCIAGWNNGAYPQAGWPGHPAITLNLAGESQTAPPVILAGARNEYLFFTIRVEPGPSALEVRTEGLPAGLECNVYRVVSAPLSLTGKFPPDALLPLAEKIPGPPDFPQLLWISFKIGDCWPGTYHLRLIISHPRGQFLLPVELKVYRFSLPEDLPITIFGGLWHQPRIWSQYAGGVPGAQLRIIKSYYKSLRDYKFNALGGSYPLPLEKLHPGQNIEDWPGYHELLKYALEDLTFKYIQVPKLRGWEAADRPEDSFRRQARIFYPLYLDYLHRHGWDHRALNYLVDEPRPDQRRAVAQALALSKSLAPGIKTLSAGGQPAPEFAGLIDIWAYQAAHYRANQRNRSGHPGPEAWLYANRLQGLDHPLAHQRLIGWLLYRYQFAGYLFWGVNFWPQDPWTTPPGPHDFFRRGTFFYPHPDTGLPVPTTRLEALRRGFQDYQYFLLLDQAGGQGLIPQEKRSLILAKVHRFTADLARNPFPVSMAEMDAVRQQIGELLEEHTRSLSGRYGL